MAPSTTTQRRTLAERPALRRCTGVDAERFAAEHWGRAPLLATGLGPFDDLLTLDAVDELLSRRGLRTPFLRLAKDGSVVPPGRYTGPGGAGAEVADQIDADAVLGLFADGATVVLQALHRTWPPLVELCSALAAELGHPVQANAYVTPPQSQGFSAHYDVHDVFVLQVAGTKRWRIHEPVHPLPLRSQPWEQHRAAVAARAAEEPAADRILEPGDALYLPRGWLHSAEALGEVSAHLTLGVHPLTRQALVESLLGLAADDVDLRIALPLGLDPDDHDALAADVRAVVDRLSALLEGVGPADVADDLHRRLARATRPAPLAPVAQSAAAAALHLDDVVGWRPYLRARTTTTAEGRVRLDLGDRWLDLPASTRAALDQLATGDPMRVVDLPLPAEDALVVVRRLLREGVLVPRR